MVATEKVLFLQTHKENIKKVANFLQHLNMLTSYIQKKEKRNISADIKHVAIFKNIFFS